MAASTPAEVKPPAGGEVFHDCARCGMPRSVRTPGTRCWACIDSERNYIERKLRRRVK